jgi:hypothetical protein
MKLKKHNVNDWNDNNSNRTMTESANKTVLQVLALIYTLNERPRS